MSKVKLELPETGAKDEAQTETQDGEPKDVQDLTGFLWILVAASYHFYLFKNFVSNVYCKVQTLLQQMQDKFQDMSDQIINRIDEMGARIDDLEKNIGELMTQAGVDEPEK